jgi:chromate transporter
MDRILVDERRWIEALRGNRRLTAALSAITAAVVGVICNLALWFAIHVAFAQAVEVPFAGGTWTIPVWSTVKPLPLLLAIGSAVALLRFRAPMIPTLLVCAVLGLAATMLGA